VCTKGVSQNHNTEERCGGDINIHTTQETDRQTNNIDRDQTHAQIEVRGDSTHLQHIFQRVSNVDPSVQSLF